MKMRIIGLCILLSLVGLFFRSEHKLKVNPSWIDEEFQVENTNKPFKPFWGWNAYGDATCFPGDYVLTYPFVRLSNANFWVIRIPHIVATVLGLWLFYIVASYYLKTIWGFAIAFGLMAFNRSLIEHSFEIRPYAVLPTLALLSLYCAHRIFDPQRPLTLNSRIKICLVYAFIGFFHAYGAFMIILPLAYCFMRSFGLSKLKEVLRSHGTFLCLAILPSLGIWFWYMAGSNKLFIMGGLNMDTFRYIPSPLINPIGFLKGVFCNLVGYKPFYVLLMGVAALALARGKELWYRVGFLLVLVLLPIELIGISDLMNEYYFIQRQFVWVMPYFAIWLAWQWEAIISFLRGSLSRR